MILQNRVSLDNHKLKEIIDQLAHNEVEFLTLSSLVQKCGAAKDLSEGTRLHAHLIKRGLHKNLLLGNRLLQMYLSCGSFPDVVDCFHCMHQKNGFSWNFYITAYARDGRHEDAVCAFWRMQCEGFLPNEFVFSSVISACTSGAALTNGRNIHTQVAQSEAQSSVAVLNALVNMYARCSFLTDARRLFDQMLDRNVVSWTGMISAYSRNEHMEDALFLYTQMGQEGVLPNQMTFASVLNVCVIPDLLFEGKQVHACVVACVLESEIILATALLTMYGKCGSLKDAFEVFLCLSERNTRLWTAMIWSCIKQEQPDRALQLYNRMLLEGGLPDAITHSTVLDGCSSQETLMIGKQVHAALVADVLPCDTVAATSLLNMYGRIGALEEAQLFFDKMELHNPVSWTSMIGSYVRYAESMLAIQLFMQMQMDGVPPEKVTFWRVIAACADEGAINEGRWVHGLLVANGLDSDLAVARALVIMYGKCEELSEAQYIFNSMQERNLVSWTGMMTAYVQCGADKEALLLYDRMLQEGFIPDKVTFICILSACGNEAHIVKGKGVHCTVADSEFFHEVVLMTALVSMYGNCGSPDDARRVFDVMKVRNVISWNAMFAAYLYSGCSSGALELFKEMLVLGIIPNKSSLVYYLDACASQERLGRGELTHSMAVKSGYDSDVDIGNVIMNMYGKCGRLKDAHMVFKQMHLLDVVSWNTMIGLLAQHGYPKAVFRLFEEMLAEGHFPDEVTYVGVLSVCSYAGLVSEGLHYFSSLTKDHNITSTAEHCHCMIYMFARAGLSHEGESFLEKLPVQPTSITWTSLLNSNKGHYDIHQGEYIVQHVIELDEESASPYVMLSNMYAATKNEGYILDSGCMDEIICEAVSSY